MKFLLLVLVCVAFSQWQLKSLRYKLQVKDIEKTKNYYEKTLGFDLVYDIDPLVIFDPHSEDSVLQFILNPNARENTGSFLLFKVQSADKIWERINRKVNVTTPIRDAYWGRHFFFKDINNFTIGYYNERNFTGNETQVVLESPLNTFDRRFQFYNNTLKLNCITSWNRGSDRGAIFVMSKSTRIEIQTNNVRPHHGIRMSHKIPDVWKTWNLLKDKVRIIYPLRDNPWSDTSFGFYDPDGFEIEFWTRRT